MKMKKILRPSPRKILLAVVIPFVLIFAIIYSILSEVGVVIVHLTGQIIFSDNPQVDAFLKSLVYASVYTIPNLIWSYPLASYIMEKRR